MTPLKSLTISEVNTIATSFGIIILAAGASSRLGKPKQLLYYKGTTLVRRQVEAALGSIAKAVIVVVGANGADVKRDINNAQINMVLNEEHAEGIGSSIRCGVSYITKMNPGIDALIIMVCDQPFVNAALIDQLINTHKQAGKKIISSSYDNTYGPPTLFHKDLFEELMQLTGDVGARKVVQKHMDKVELVPFPEGGIDIDTEEDYRRLVDLL